MEGFSYPKVYLYRRIVQAKLYMDAHFRERLDLNNIAGEAFFSKYHFIRLFRKTVGKTPHQYLIAIRIDKAKQLLQTGLPIADVCISVGFESVSSFTGLFKRMEKVTPSNFQSEQHRKKNEISHTPLKYIPHCFAKKKGWTKKSNFQEVAG